MSVLNIDPATEMRALVLAQLDAIANPDTRHDRIYGMWMCVHAQLHDCVDPTTQKVLKLRAAVLHSILLGVDFVLPEDNDPESLVQSGLDGRGYAIVLGYN